MILKVGNWYYVKKLNEKPDYFNNKGYMDHLMDGKHKVKCVDVKYNNFYDPVSDINWFIKIEHISPLKEKLKNILNR